MYLSSIEPGADHGRRPQPGLQGQSGGRGRAPAQQFPGGQADPKAGRRRD
ncbi:MAG: hypothetical protein GKR89_20470 [Candidatus Latescibacteria bacterium]|nr:hypothetical protein [Candidatus Latescibacterota bacterium]